MWRSTAPATRGRSVFLFGVAAIGLVAALVGAWLDWLWWPVYSGIAIAAPIVFATTVSSSSWAVAFLLAALVPLAGRLALRPLRAY